MLFLCNFSLNLMAREPLSFEERVKAQEAIERVYYNHRIWPKDNPEPKPPFEKMVPKAVIEAKVTDYLKKCNALDKFWQRPIEPKQLQAEMDRMAKQSKDPATLKELFAALKDDPYLIAECLARPSLTEHLIQNWYWYDSRFQREAREMAEKALEDLKGGDFRTYPTGEYSHLVVSVGDDVDDFLPKPGEEVHNGIIKLSSPSDEYEQYAAELPEPGGIVIKEERDAFMVQRTITKESQIAEVEQRRFNKATFNAWWQNEQQSLGVIITPAMVQLT